MYFHAKLIAALISCIRYAIGLFFLIGAIAIFFDGNILFAAFAFLLGIVLTPVISNFIENKISISLSVPMRLIILFCLFTGFVIVAPSDHSEVQPLKANYHNPIVSIESAPQQVNNSTTASVAAVTKHVKESNPEPVPTATKKPVEAETEEIKQSNLEPVKSKEKSTANYQDVQWLAVAEHESQIVGQDLANVGKAASSSDYTSMSNCGCALYYDSQAAIEESSKYEVSPALQPAKDEFETALYYSSNAGSDTISAVYELNQGRTDKAKEYLTSTADNMKKCADHTKMGSRIVDEYKSNL